MEAERLLEQLVAGFDALQEEYQKLFNRHQALERKLTTAREQYNKLAKLHDTADVTTPPLSLSSALSQNKESSAILTVPQILEQSRNVPSQRASKRVRAAIEAASSLRDGFPLQDAPISGVKIWAGPSADKPDRSNSLMPSIYESPLEQDFTIEGRPSSLGCPFASMANKKLSSHAASVLSRYNQGSAGAASVSSSSVNRVNGRESLALRASRRPSIPDPIKAEICGLSDHDEPVKPIAPEVEAAAADRDAEEGEGENADSAVCPIRFLDQHSPEEIATYFERHKHELPRSHEICVKRYQSNEEQIRELDAKYGNLVSMIQGLGAKHRDMLPDEPDPEEEEHSSIVDDAKVRQWASSVSRADAVIDPDAAGEERQPHFERSLREVRVGESPSRPWGISVPAQYYEHPASVRSDKPALAQTEDNKPVEAEKPAPEKKPDRAAGKCPFGFHEKGAAPSPSKAPIAGANTSTFVEPPTRQPTFISTLPEAKGTSGYRNENQADKPQMVFSGPVFIGYSAEDAAKILQVSGFGKTA